MSVEERVNDQTLERAVLAYLGKGRSAFPRHDEDAVHDVAAEADVDPDALVGTVVSLTEECLAIKIDWSNTTLSEGGDEVERVMRARHPELGAAAVDALRWAFTYNWR